MKLRIVKDGELYRLDTLTDVARAAFIHFAPNHFQYNTTEREVKKFCLIAALHGVDTEVIT